MANKKQTSVTISILAFGVLKNLNTAKIKKSLAGTILSQ